MGSSSSTTATISRSSTDDHEVLIEGPLEQRVLFFFWRPRWCVLDQAELRIYRDERAATLSSEPLESLNVSSFNVAKDAHNPSVLTFSDVCDDSGANGDAFLFLRTGPGGRWEEFAASSLWQRVLHSARRDATSVAGLVAAVSKPH